MQPKEHSKVEPHSSWTDQEKWVWSRISKGEVADFSSAKDYGGKLDPKKPEEWPESRILTPAFLEMMLLHEPYRGSSIRHGVRIIGAWFKDQIDLSNAILANQLWLESSRFDSEVYLSSLKTSYLISIEGSSFNSILHMDSLQVGNLFMRNGAEFDEVILLGARINGTLEMYGSKFKGKLHMNSLQVGSSLFMRNGAEFDEVVLNGTRIDETLDMDGSKFKGKLHMNSLQVGCSLYMRNGAEFDEVVLNGARIGETLEMDGSKFKGKLHMNKVQVESSMFMRNGAEFDEVVLNNIKVGGTLDMNSSKFKGKLHMNSLQVGSSLFMINGAEFDEVVLIGARIDGSLEMDNSEFNDKLHMENLNVKGNFFLRNGEVKNKMYLIFARIGISLFISGSKFQYLNLTGTQINDEFCLGSGIHLSVKWEKESELILRNAKVGTLQDLPDAWPDEIELIGFTYSQLGGLGEVETYSMPKRDVSWMKEWIEKQKYYSPQPYEQLGKVLREAGYKNKANDILFEGKKRERSKTKSWLAWLNLTSQYYSVGFGYRYRYAFRWVIALTLLGAIVLWATGQGLANGMPCGLSYSLDMLLPIIRLNESHYDIILKGIAKYYFYIHKILGYGLASFLIAGLTGITKR
jgi:cytoskeletal protein CcmA (bactofilin family)